MSENLKRAESLFNRIMNQNGSGNGGNYNPGSSGLGNGNGSNVNGRKHEKRRDDINSNNNPNNSHNNNITNTNGANSNNHYHHYNNHHHHHKYNKYNNNSSSGSNNRVAYVDLPKKDPIKTAQDCVELIPDDHHILPYCWTIWHHSRTKQKQKEEESKELKEQKETSETSNSKDSQSILSGSTSSLSSSVSNNNNNNNNNNNTEENAQTNLNEEVQNGVNTYLQTTNEIEFPRIDNVNQVTSSIGSLEQMWASLSSLKKTDELPYGTELLVFKSGVNPVWEDPLNTKGGRWVFRFIRKPPNNLDPDYGKNLRKKTALIWERLLLRTMTGSIIPEGTYSEEIQDSLLNDISGLVLSVRRDEDIISIWNSNLNFNKKKNTEDDKLQQQKRLTSFQARRIICDSILRILRECNLILQGSDSVDTLDGGLNERVYGVSFEYRLHSDNNQPQEKRRYPKSYIKESSNSLPTNSTNISTTQEI